MMHIVNRYESFLVMSVLLYHCKVHDKFTTYELV